MLTIVHLGGGGTYSRYAQDCIRRIARRRGARLETRLRVGSSQYVVAVVDGGPMLDDAGLGQMLQEHEDVVFVVGDSNGMPSEALLSCDAQVAVSGLTLGHQVQAMVLAEALERAVYGEVAV